MGHQFSFREKQGFGMPLEKWFRSNPRNQSELRDRLCHSGTRIGEFFSKEAIAQTVLSGRVENVWLLLILDEWFCQTSESISSAVA